MFNLSKLRSIIIISGSGRPARAENNSRLINQPNFGITLYDYVFKFYAMRQKVL